MMHEDNGKERGTRAEKRRRAIMQAAWRVFAEHGYERSSMDAIQAVCGGSKATLYSYFRSKEELFLEASSARALELSAVAFKDFPVSKVPVEALYAFGVSYLRFYLNSDLIEVFRLAAAEGKKLPFGEMLYEKCFKTSWGKIAAYLEQHVAPERMLPGGGWTAAMHLRGLLDGDTLMRRSWGIMGELPLETYQGMAATATTAFLRIYAPEALAGASFVVNGQS